MQARPWQALIMGLLVTFCAYILMAVLAWPLILYAFGVDMDTLQLIVSGERQTEADLLLYKILQGSYQLLVWGLAGVVMIHWIGYGGSIFRLQNPLDPQQIGLATLIMLASIPVVQFLQIDPETFQPPAFLADWAAWAKEAELRTQDLLAAMLANKGIPDLLFNLFIFAALPAICEEVFFRGFLQTQFTRILGPWGAICVTAIIFSFVHFQFYGFFPRLVLGALLGFFYYRSNNLWPNVVAHFAFNATMVIATYAVQRQGEALADTALETFPWTWVVGSCLLIAGLGYVFLQATRSTRGIPPHHSS